MDVDVVVIGGGIAGVSCAAFLAPSTSVVVLEMETTLGYHATGRSAALYTECYGAEPIRRMSLASKSYFVDRAQPFGTRRGVLFLAPSSGRSSVDTFYETFSVLVPELEVLSPVEVSNLIGVIPTELTSGGVLEPEALDLDVHAILTSYASTVRAHDGAILTASRAIEVERRADRWRIRAGEHVITASTLVNAAGAWGDELASIATVDPIGLTPLKRSAFTFDPGVPVDDWPVVVEMGETWYMKPEGPFLLGSAASEIPQEPSDARHDEIDIALGIERITEATTMKIRSVKNQWAGLRTFTPDRVPAVGRDPEMPDFFWLVGQGGYGVHTSPAMGSMAAGLILDSRVPESVAEFGITSEMFDPARFRR
jgi:D-arginine dehydrogenase